MRVHMATSGRALDPIRHLYEGDLSPYPDARPADGDSAVWFDVEALLVLLRAEKSRPAEVTGGDGPGRSRRGTGRGSRTAPPVLQLGPSMVLPVAILVRWWIRGTLAGRETVAVWGELGRSVTVSVVAAILIVLVAVPLAFLTVRYRSRVGQIAETVAWTVYALPHLTVGLAVLLTGVSLVLPLYQSLALLLFAYLMMFLPQALGPARCPPQGFADPEEAADRWAGTDRTVFKVTLPLLPGLLAEPVGSYDHEGVPATPAVRPTIRDPGVESGPLPPRGFYPRHFAASS